MIPQSAQAAVPVVELSVVSKEYRLRGGGPPHRAVDDVSLTIREGETFGLVGESGSGKSTLARLVLGIERPTAGDVRFLGQLLSGARLRRMRGLRREMQLVFQDPVSSLNRRKTVAQLVAAPLCVHGVPRDERRRRVREVLDLVGLDERYEERYPSQLSGGQCQRVGIARALALEPRLIVLDEPVSAVDVSIRAQILNLLRDLQESLGLTFLYISHDLSTVRYLASSVGVMYQGRIVELASRDRLFAEPRHPYTRALLAAVPQVGTEVAPSPDQAPEQVADHAEASGCRYRARCAVGRDRDLCRADDPVLIARDGGHSVACHFPAGPGSAGP